MPLPESILLLLKRSADAAELAAIFSRAGYEIYIAQGGEDALREARARPLIAAVVDIAFGGLAAEALRHACEHPRLPLLFVSNEAPGEATWKQIYSLELADLVMLATPAAVWPAKIRLLSAARDGLRPAPSAAGDTQRQQERYQLLSEAASDFALFFLDPKGIVTEWTVSAAALFGHSSAEMVGRSGEIIFTPEDLAAGAAETEMAEAARVGQAKDNRFHVRKDGSRFPAIGRMVALRTAEGRVAGFAKIIRDATTLHQLEQSERKFRRIFDAAHEGIWILDADGRVQLVNRRMAEMLGHDIAELVGRRQGDFVFPEEAAKIDELFAARRAGQASTVEVRLRRKDGTPLWTLMSGRAIHEDGEFVGALDMFSDLTAWRTAEQRFRVFFESSAAGYGLVDPTTGRYLMVNRRWCEMVGRTREELLQLTVQDLTHPEDRAFDAERFADLFEGRVAEVTGEKRYLRADGSFFWGQLTTCLVRDRGGRPEFQLGVVQDISERKRVEAELIESRTRLRLAVEAAELGICFYDEGTGEHAWNEHARRLLGFEHEPSAITSAQVLERVHPEDRARMRDEMARIKESTAVREADLEFRVQLPNRIERYLALHLLSERRADAAGAVRLHVLATLRDVTAAKRAELDLRNKVAERTQALEDKTRQLEAFVYTVAHDLRAPLRSINGFAELLIEEGNTMSPDEVRTNLERIKASTRRMDELIRDLLAYSRVSQVELTIETVDLKIITQNVVRELQPEIARKNARVTVIDPLPRVRGERVIVDHAILNLLNNAVKFSRPGEPPVVQVKAQQKDGWVRFEVRDEGIGIPAQYHERIFQVFERLQTSREYPGTGIGLAIVAKGMARIGGRYGVQSEAGRGSVFWLELKAADS